MMHPTALLRHIIALRLQLQELSTQAGQETLINKNKEELGMFLTLRQEFSDFPEETQSRAKRSCMEFAGVGLLAQTMEKINNRMGKPTGKRNADAILEETRDRIRDPEIEGYASEILHDAMTHKDVLQKNISPLAVMRYARKRLRYLLTTLD